MTVAVLRVFYARALEERDRSWSEYLEAYRTDPASVVSREAGYTFDAWSHVLRHCEQKAREHGVRLEVDS